MQKNFILNLFRKKQVKTPEEQEGNNLKQYSI